jgi:hypothetical protein
VVLTEKTKTRKRNTKGEETREDMRMRKISVERRR